MNVSGIHHITAIAADAQRNIDFYCGVLGLRLVKITVNFDDPTSYHFYYGDARGRPGSILTFFAWNGAFRGREGNGQISTSALSIPRDSAAFWRARLENAGVTTALDERFGLMRLSFRDLDGLPLELVENDDSRDGWQTTETGYAHAIRGIYGATATVPDIEHSAAMLAVLGLNRVGEENGRVQFQAGAAPGGMLELEENRTLRRGTTGPGQVHHIAWRVPDDATELAFRATLEREGANVSPVMERSYFRSIYFREPGGVLYEIATDAPGFAIDEDAETLGEKLMLPPQYETQRALIEQSLAPLRLPSGHSLP
jgi:glyoxalase family protein